MAAIVFLEHQATWLLASRRIGQIAVEETAKEPAGYRLEVVMEIDIRPVVPVFLYHCEFYRYTSVLQ